VRTDRRILDDCSGDESVVVDQAELMALTCCGRLGEAFAVPERR
jgi:hypothetical protein